MTRNELISFTKTLLNEISPTNGLPIPIDGFADDRPIDDMIGQLLDPATRIVLQLCPDGLVPETEWNLAGFGVETDGSALVAKPTDYIRLLGIRLSGWQRRVVAVAPANSEQARRQCNAYLRAGYAKPVVVDVGSHLQLWPAKAADFVGARATYVADTQPENLALPLQMALCWQTATFYLQAVAQPNAAQQAESRVREYLQT